MNAQSNKILNKKINELKIELDQLSNQIEKERAENSDENPALQELLDKKEFLLGEIETLSNPDESITGESTNGVGIIYKVEHGRSTKTFKIVIPTEANSLKGYISSQSPIAKALQGRKAGDKIEVETPAGKVVYKIKAVTK